MHFLKEELTAKKTFLSGTHRARRFEQTLEWLWPKGRQIGVTRLANITGLDLIGIPVWTAIRPNSRGLATSQGKGLIDVAAKVSALMESVESWHAETIELPVRIGDYESISLRGAAVDPFTLNYYSDAPLRPDVGHAWLEGFDLIAQVPRWVPFECISTNYVVHTDWAHKPTFVQSSNGLAGGNHLLEAISHALAEVIERHAIAQDAKRIRSFSTELRVRLSSIDDHDCRDLIDRLERAGLMVAVFELSGSFGIPAFACSIIDAQETSTWRTLPPFNGYGCHLDAGIALSRALTEAAQSRVTYISGSRDDIAASEYARSGNPDDLRAYRKLFNGNAATRSFATTSLRAAGTFEEDVHQMISTLASCGYDQVVVVDLSKPGLDVPVVKVVVPGLAAAETLLQGRPVGVPAARAGVGAL
ncbi:MAG: YcaO-like family protein [Vulcanimicrobiaceae bacterium]